MDIKIENADPRSSHPLVFDVVGAADKPVATHVLKFGEFVIVGSLENLVVVNWEDWTERQMKAEADAKAATEAANAKAHAAAPSKTAAADVKLKRHDLEDLTKDELEAYAENHGIEVSHSWTKADIVDAIVHSRK